jgi:hypothetical protein
MTGLTNIPAGTDAAAEAETNDDAGGPEEADPPVDAETEGEPGAFVMSAPEQAWARTTVTSATDLRGDPPPRIVNP